MTRLQTVVVVVPARDEEDLLPLCLDSVRAAGNQLARVRPHVACEVIVVLDVCTDDTGGVAASRGAVVVTSDHGSVGAARALGVRTALEGRDPAATWVANTDADTVVPAHWLVRQVELAEAGHDLLTGTVEPGFADEDPQLLARWHALHVLADEHPYIHAANLGIRGSTYQWLGGFDHVATHEDLRLVTRAAEAGVTVTATDAIRVRTSSRLVARAPDGFASYLRQLIPGA
ncbi:MAG: glycosyltransferase [Nocardioides sp.]|nr:glycosyltransferase [Nocardioides sp.]